MSFQITPSQSIAVGKCVGYCIKKCWEWTKQEEQKHREIGKLERERERIREQLMIFKQQEKIRKEKEAMNDDDDDDDGNDDDGNDDDDVLEILKNINIDEIIKEFQIINKK
jgi:hypothetical protein